MDKRDVLLSEVLEMINKYSITAYEISQGTGISAVGIQKIINGESKRPLERTLLAITSYIEEKHISNNDTKNELDECNNIKNLPHGEQMALLQKEIKDLKQQIQNQKEENANNTKKIIDFVDVYLKPVFDFMQESIEHKKKDNLK